ncbi:bifunctional phosphopantothenoylcysteine decarboxylase/phosphopantothenate--cysteine ligase CoaBC [Sulfurimonas sp. HSL-1716]|uniref:bifunctional phosphopantothenoylcysteine decarboxylase/phosphopantothenate--cysteine ligase CoaBC n=1 Tax=Hydrocurvibacter sulfurireducens TaxID=3131937 RepID=UPI0031F86BC8
MVIPSDLLKDKKILLGVTGSIAIYKSLELIRLLTKAGADVRVVMSEAAKKFVTPLTFEALCTNKVLDEQSESWSSDHNHIKTTEWADIFVIAPCSANTIAKLANAVADNMLLQCALAYPYKKIIAPSANTNMLANPITQGNLKMLAIANYEVVATQTKELACKTVGDGAMAEPSEIFWYIAREILKEDFWVDRRVIVTGGGTVEKIDDVRYISNFSSGKMASALAAALFCKGADVNLIATKFDADLPKAVHTIDVSSSEEMQEFVTDSIRIAKKGKLSKPSLASDKPIELIQKEPYLFMAAAVSDYIPAYAQNGKLKKEALGSSWSLELKQNTDILKNVDKEGIKVVGFKAETDAAHAKENAASLITDKGADAVCLNLLSDDKSFGTDDNEIEFITKEGSLTLARTDKLSLSFKILENAKQL